MDESENSGASTPNSRFVSQNLAVEDRLKSQTVGLVHLADFRKRRAEALDVPDQDSSDSRAATPSDTERVNKQTKKRKAAKKGALSFGDDGDDEQPTIASKKQSRADIPTTTSTPSAAEDAADSENTEPVKKRLAANAGVGFVAKSMTKNALEKEAKAKDQLRREYLIIQEAVKATEFVLPFVFYDGVDIPGGKCRMKKGDQIWLFLDRARKVGAGQATGTGKSVSQWARVSVDDLMLVRGDLIIPPHYEFYYFLANKTIGYYGRLFPHSADPTSTTPLDPSETSMQAGLSVPSGSSNGQKARTSVPAHPDSELEGIDEDPSQTKVVDRRWYERNKHIYPASTWTDFDPSKDYSSGTRKDAQGNVFFSSSR